MGSELSFVGRAKEKQRVGAAAQDRESLLVLGSAGIGKTRLISEAIPSGEALHIRWETSLHKLLVTFARSLIDARHTAFLDRAKPPANVEAWLGTQPSIHLKGLLWNALQAAPALMILDGITGAGFPTYRFLQRVYHIRGMALVASARDHAGLGALGRLFWHPAGIVSLAPLSEREAEHLFESAADEYELRNLDLGDFREKVLASATGNPGQIIEMCRLAAQPQYHAGRYIKFSPLRIDAVIKFSA
jgi:hypothetical protein